MKNLVLGATLLVGLGFFSACSPRPVLPGASHVPGEDARRPYGEQPEDQRAGAVESLDSEEESGGHFNTMVDMLQGRVAGLQIGQAPNGEISVRIRGDQSIYFNQNPLLVVNGVTVPGYSFSATLRAMNPRDVRNITVLKDTGSTAIYGTRGAHGVIIISLKRR